jgi:hypothetical protein
MAKLKVLVKVKTASGEYVKIKKIEDDGETIIMQKQRGKRPEWHFNLKGSSLYWSRRFGKRWPSVDVFQWASKAVSYQWETKEVDAPLYDRATEQEIVNKAILDKAGEKVPGQQPGLIVAVLFLCIIIVFMLAYLMFKAGII